MVSLREKLALPAPAFSHPVLISAGRGRFTGSETQVRGNSWQGGPSPVPGTPLFFPQTQGGRKWALLPLQGAREPRDREGAGNGTHLWPPCWRQELLSGSSEEPSAVLTLGVSSCHPEAEGRGWHHLTPFHPPQPSASWAPSLAVQPLLFRLLLQLRAASPFPSSSSLTAPS